MDSVKISFSQYLRGYNSVDFSNFKTMSPNLSFLSPEYQNGHMRDSGLPIETNGQMGKHPVYEIQAFDFDRWAVINTDNIFNVRVAPFSQYIAFDGMNMKLSPEDMDKFRIAFAAAADPEQHNLFLDQERYIDIAENGEMLEEGMLTIKVNDVKQPAMSKEMAYLVMRIWENCWRRMMAVINRTGIELPRYIELYADRKQQDPMRTCVDLFCNWLSRILPPQVMSMISVTMGATYSEQKWEDSACRFLVDGANAPESDRNAMFCLEGIYNGVPGSIVAPKGWKNMYHWENAIVEHILEGKLPKYFEFIERAMIENRCASANEERTGLHNVMVRADYDLLCRCMAVELYLNMPDDEFGYDQFAEANKFVGEMVNILLNRYGFSTADIHMLLGDIENSLAERAVALNEPLDEYEYKDFAFIYKEIEQSDIKLAGKLLNLLGKQCVYEDSRTLIAKDEEIAEIPNIFHCVLSTEINTVLNGANLDRDEFIRWAELYRTVENYGKDNAAEKLTAELSRCLRFADEGMTPLELAEKYDLDKVITGIVRGIVADHADRRMGRLSHEEYMQVMELYTDYRYSARLDAETTAMAKELLVSQFGFEDSDAVVADILAQKEQPELWNTCVKSECEVLNARSMMFEDEHFALWTERLGYESIDADTAKAITAMIVAKTANDKAKDRIITSAGKELPELEEGLVLRQVAGMNSSDNLMNVADFKWWIERYNDAQLNAKPFAENIFGMLEKARLREKEFDILEVVRECRQWRLLGALVRREIPGVKNLNSERFDKWITIYNDLQNADVDMDHEAIKACEELLNTRITYDTIKQLEFVRDQGTLFWDSLGTLVENQKKANGNMKVDDFITWLKYLREAENEGNPVSADIRAMLNAQCRLRDTAENGMKFAYDVAVAAQCTDTQLLVELIRTEFGETIGETGVRNMANVDRWLALYEYLNNQGEKFAETVADKLCEKAKVEGRFILDIARERGAVELVNKLIATEHSELAENNSIRDMESLRRWMQHYATARANGDENMEKTIAEKICQRPILDGQYVLETVLEMGGEDMEEAMLECEKNAARAYNPDEYSFRLERYFSNRCSDLYLELLSAKGVRSDNLDRFLRFLQNRTMSSENVRSGGDLLEKLAKDNRRFGEETMNGFRAVSTMEPAKEMLRANQQVLDQILVQAVQEGMNMAEMQCFYVLRDGSADKLQPLNDRAIGEFADALVNNQTDYNVSVFNSYFKNGIEDAVAESIRSGVATRLSNRKVDNAAIDTAARLLNEVHFPSASAVDTLGELLMKSAGKIDLNVLLDFVLNRDQQMCERMVMHIAKWMHIAEAQPSAVLDAIVAFTNKLHGDSLERVSAQLFDSICAYLTLGNECASTEIKTYERINELWGQNSRITAVIYPLLNDNPALADVRVNYVREMLNNGPLSLNEKFANIIKSRNLIEIADVREVLAKAASIEEFAEATAADKLPWLDNEAFSAIAAEENVAGGITALTENELAKKVNAELVNGNRTPVMSALGEMVMMINSLKTISAISECFSARLNDCINARVKNAFDECVKLFDAKNVGETINGLNRLKSLLTRIGADATCPISNVTVEWCENFANAAARGVSDARLVREIHANRRDFEALRQFVTRVYESYLSGVSFSVDQIYVLLAAAKVMSIENVWTRYICMAAKMPLDKENIWQPGHEVAVVMHVVLLYSKLDEIGDDVVNAVSLADYCAEDPNFASQQKKQKNRELKMILDRGKADDNKPGLFGRLFGKK